MEQRFDFEEAYVVATTSSKTKKTHFDVFSDNDAFSPGEWEDIQPIDIPTRAEARYDEYMTKPKKKNVVPQDVGLTYNPFADAFQKK